MKDPLSRLDLNLLVAFQVILQERSVTKAAQRLFVTQPAMSKTLKRLRALTDDELFVRTSHGLIPTAKAIEWEQPIAEIIEQLTTLLLKNKPFDPSTTSATISLATLGASSNIGLPRFIGRLRNEAPNILLISQNIDHQYKDRLRNGSLDFAIVAHRNLGDEFISHSLMHIKPALYMRKAHPLANQEIISNEDRQAYAHMAVYFPNFETTKEDMRKLFRSFGIKSIPFLSTNLMVCLETLLQSDTLMIASDRLIDSELIKQHYARKPLEGPINLKIDTLSLIQHVRTERSAVHNYLVELVKQSFAPIENQSAPAE